MEPAVDRAGDVQAERPELHPPPGDCDAPVPRDGPDHDLVVQHQGGTIIFNMARLLFIIGGTERGLGGKTMTMGAHKIVTIVAVCYMGRSIFRSASGLSTIYTCTNADTIMN